MLNRLPGKPWRTTVREHVHRPVLLSRAPGLLIGSSLLRAPVGLLRRPPGIFAGAPPTPGILYFRGKAGTANLGDPTIVRTAGGDLQRAALSGSTVVPAGSNVATETIDLVVIIGDGVNTITTGVNANWTSQFDFAATIVQWSVVADASGSISIDVWKCTYTQFDAGATHPVAGDKISASAPITFSTATKGQSSTLTGWTTAIAAGDLLAFNVASITTCKRVVINIKLTKTT